MTLWRIKDGIPSLADALFVSGGFYGTVLVGIPPAFPILDYLDARGLLWLGYAVLVIVGSAVCGLGYWLFIRNQKKLSADIRAPRLIFAIAAPMLISFLHSLLGPMFSADRAWLDLGLSLILAFALLYMIVVRVALRYPAQATFVGMCLLVGMGVVGAVVKATVFLSKQ